MNNEINISDKNTSETDLERFEERLSAAKAKHAPDVDDVSDGTILGMAWRLSTEIIVAVLVGMGLGYGLDKLLGTKPWIMLVGVAFGFAAGIMNVMRSAAKMDAATSHIPIGEDIGYDDENE